MATRQKVLATLAGSLWLAMAAWNLVDLLHAVGEPGAGVDVRRLVTIVAAVACGLPLGGACGALLGWLPSFRPVTVSGQVVLALQTLGTAAMALTSAMLVTVTHAGSDPTGPRVTDVVFGMCGGAFVSFGLMLLAVATWRTIEESRVPRDSAVHAARG